MNQSRPLGKFFFFFGHLNRCLTASILIRSVRMKVDNMARLTYSALEPFCNENTTKYEEKRAAGEKFVRKRNFFLLKLSSVITYVTSKICFLFYSTYIKSRTTHVTFHYTIQFKLKNCHPFPSSFFSESFF